MKKLLLTLAAVCLAACGEDAKPTEPAASTVASQPVKPAPKPMTLAEEAQTLANMMAQFEQENANRGDTQQSTYTETTSGEEAAKEVRAEAAALREQIKRLQGLNLKQPKVVAIRDKLISAYEADIVVAEQTARFFIAAEASSPEAQAEVASEPVPPEIDSAVVEEQALNELGLLLKEAMASEPVGASAASAASAS